MALVVKDRVQETSTTTGTGTFTLAGSVSGFQSFSTIGNGNTTYYAIVGGTEWEVGIGTYTLIGTTLSRDTILASSNGGSAVNFSAGTKNVFVTYPAGKGIYTDASGNAIALGTPASATLTNATGLPLSTGVTGTLPIANGGTGTTSTTFASLTTNVTGTLPATNGGTGTATTAVGDLIQGAATNTWSKLAAVATGNALISGGLTTASSWGKIGLTTHVSGTLPVASGGTNQTTYTDGQLLIGNSTGNTLTKATITAGTGISVTNGSGAITIANTITAAQIQSQLFTAPGTWTCPSTTTQVRVTVIGGGGGFGFPSGSAGSTSSFGALVSATGGTAGQPSGPGTQVANGTGTVTTGTALKTGTVCSINATPTNASRTGVLVYQTFGNIFGLVGKALGGVPAATAYTTSLNFVAGSQGGATGDTRSGGNGGLAIAICPVSSPVTVTVGAGGATTNASPTPAGDGGVGGAVLVEFVS